MGRSYLKCYFVSGTVRNFGIKDFESSLTTKSSPMPGPAIDDFLLPPLDWAYLQKKMISRLNILKDKCIFDGVDGLTNQLLKVKQLP